MSENTEKTNCGTGKCGTACCSGKGKIFVILGVLVVLALGIVAYATDMLPMGNKANGLDKDGQITFDPEKGPEKEINIGGQVLKPGNPVVAVVDGEEIKRSDVLNFIGQLPEQMRQGPLPQLFPMAVEQTINAHLLEEQAEKAGTAEREDVQKQIAETKKNIIRTAYVQDLVNQGVTESKVKKRYAEYVSDVKPVEEVKASHILVKTEEEANELIQKLNSGASFEELAKEHSIGPTGASGGDLGYFSKDQMVPEFSEAAFATKEGTYAKTPVKTQFGWHVLKVDDKRTKEKPSLDKIRPFIETEIKRDVLDDALADWKSNKKIVVYDINGEPLENTSSDEAVEEEEDEVIEEGMADDMSGVAPAAGDSEEVAEEVAPAEAE